MATKFLFEHKPSGAKITVDNRRGLDKAAEAAREKASAEKTTPPAWACNPGACDLVKEFEEEAPAPAPKPAAAPAK